MKRVMVVLVFLLGFVNARVDGNTHPYLSHTLFPYYKKVLAEVKRNGMETKEDIALIYAIMEVESHMNPMARSRKGAIGLMQVMPRTARAVDISRHRQKRMLGQYKKILQDPARNIEYGVARIKEAKERFGDDPAKIAADYNGGESHVHNPLPETVAFIAKVKSTLPKYTLGVVAR